jgi:ABC-type nitrate/sulfonate/bicarbonate transport system substrate-binding protein
LRSLEIKLASNRFAFHWSFPEILADARGFFASENVQIQWTDVTPQKSMNKSEMYIDILERDIADLYHAADWVCIDRTTKSKKGWMVAKSPAQPGTLNSSFTLFSQKDSGISAPKDLAGLPIAVDLGTGSYYTALQDLERFISRERINVVQIGEPSQRLVALLEGRVSGASLLSPWADFARALGMTEVLKTSRAGSTVLVARRDLGLDVLRNFFNAVNRAIGLIDRDPNSCREEYFSKIETILPSMPEPVKKAAESLKPTIPVPAWAPWEPFSEKDFELAYNWMVDRRLALPGLHYADVSFVNATSLF